MPPPDPDAPPALIPVLFKRTEGPIPLSEERPSAYVAARNGLFLATRTAAFEAAVPVAEIPNLAPVEPGARYLLPPMLPGLTRRILGFFLAALERFGSEAIVIVFHHPTEGFRIEAPAQTVSPTSCRYGEPPAVPDGFRPIGTVHSHGMMHAFHSGTDLHDEISHDGVHATFGRISEQTFEISAELAVSGHRFPLDPLQVFAGIAPVAAEPPAPEPEPRRSARPPAGRRELLVAHPSRPPKPALPRYRLLAETEAADEPAAIDAWLAKIQSRPPPPALVAPLPDKIDGRRGKRYQAPQTLQALLAFDPEKSNPPPLDPKD